MTAAPARTLPKLWSLIFNGRNSVWLVVTPVLLALADFWTTLIFQSPRYWAGQYHLAIDANPAALLALQIHPVAFAAIGILTCVGWGYAILRLPRGWAIDIALFASIGHAVCVVGWYVR